MIYNPTFIFSSFPWNLLRLLKLSEINLIFLGFFLDILVFSESDRKCGGHVRTNTRFYDILLFISVFDIWYKAQTFIAAQPRQAGYACLYNVAATPEAKLLVPDWGI